MSLLRNVLFRTSTIVKRSVTGSRTNLCNVCNNVHANTVEATLLKASPAVEFLEVIPDIKEEPRKDVSVLEELEELEDISHLGLPTRQKTTFASFANHSVVVQKFIDLGVNFHRLEMKRRSAGFILQMDFEKDAKPYIEFLLGKGVPIEQLGRFFTMNPYIFLDSLDDLQVRVNYLESKRFTPEQITRLVSGHPQWLSKTTRNVDQTLGRFQRGFKLTGNELRIVMCKLPKLISLSKEGLRDMKFLLNEVSEFPPEQYRLLFMRCPYIWTLRTGLIQKRLDILLHDMEIPRSLIIEDPTGLTIRDYKLKERHLFLKKLGRNQYDPTKPGYIPIKDIACGTDVVFCEKAAKTSIETFNLFLKCM